MSMVSIAVLGVISIMLGGVLGGDLNLWLDIVSRPSDAAGKYYIKSLGACFPLLYVLLSWTALVVSVNARYVGEMDIHPIQAPLHYLPGLVLSVLPIPIFGNVLLGLRPPVTEANRGSHDHHLEHCFFALIYVFICVVGFVIFAIWGTTTIPLFLGHKAAMI